MNATLAHIQSKRGCHPLTNLKITIFDAQHRVITEDLHANVTKNLSQTPPIIVAYFTSIPPEATQFFK